MRAMFRLPLIVAVVLQAFPLPALAAEIPFPDTATSWFGYRESISYLQKKGAIGGYPDGTFHPKATVNRAEFLKLVFRARGSPEPIGGDCFLDVKEADWFAPFVCAAKRRGIIVGYPSGTGAVFKPEQPVVFSEAIKMVLEAYGKDIHAIPGNSWYEPYAKSLNDSHVLRSSSYLPWDPLTRERAADLIAKFIQFEDDKKIPNRSVGCETPPGIPPSGVHANGADREFLLTIPSHYSPSTPAPLIVAFHGRTNNNAQARAYYGFDGMNKDAFIVYPAALKNAAGRQFWNVPNDLTNDAGDIGFFDAIVETMAKSYCIDMDRIFVAGHSLGAWMSNSVACVRGDVVRASGTVGGDSVIRDCAGPASAMIMHNPHDELASFAGTEKARDLRVQEAACKTETTPVEPLQLLCREYADCIGGSRIIWCPHEIDVDDQNRWYPHHWPREAAKGIIDFFQSMK